LFPNEFREISRLPRHGAVFLGEEFPNFRRILVHFFLHCLTLKRKALLYFEESVIIQLSTHRWHHKISEYENGYLLFINALNSIWWHKNITKNRKLYIYQTIIQSILVYGAEVWQIPAREINKILSTEMYVLGRSARKSRMERTKNEHIKEIMGVKGSRTS